MAAAAAEPLVSGLARLLQDTGERRPLGEWGGPAGDGAHGPALLSVPRRRPGPGRLQHADAAHPHAAAPDAGLRAALGLPQPAPRLRGAALPPGRDRRHPPGAVPFRRAAENALSQGPSCPGWEQQ